MHRSSESIGALAAALAKAQAELVNPEKSLVATIQSTLPRGPERTFKYASLSSGLDIVRKGLGQHEIAIIQATEVDGGLGLLRLTTVLAHSSGEWVSSDWPVCPVAEAASPRRLGAALTYARRYALFALVGIAGDDDLDARDLGPSNCDGEPTSKLNEQGRLNGTEVQSAPVRANRSSGRRSPRTAPTILPVDASTSLREQLLVEIAALKAKDESVAWAHRRLPAKNSLAVDDASAVEAAFLERARSLTAEIAAGAPTEANTKPSRNSGERVVISLRKPQRIRDIAHLRFVALRPCLICAMLPSDPHHIRFAQPRALSRKVSDEFTVPLCRKHHRELHQRGNESAWWHDKAIEPLAIAKRLWSETQSDR